MLALMKDAERLALLMEVAGCKVYDERRAESERIMRDTEMRRDKVIEVVDYIQDRLRELEEEKNELKEFQKLDRDKRALEHTIYDSDLKSSRTKLQALDDERAELAEELKVKYAKSTDTTQRGKAVDAKIKALSSEADDAKATKKKLAQDVRQAAKRKTRLEMDIADGRSQREALATRKENLQTELAACAADVSSVEKKLKKVEPKYEAAVGEEAALKEQMGDNERRTKALNSKQGRAAEFSSKAERDKFLKKELATLMATLKTQQAQEKELQKEVSQMEKAAGKSSGSRERTVALLAKLKAEVDECTKRHHNLKKQRDDASDARKELWRRNSEIEANIKAARDESAKHERTLSTAWGRDAQKGLNAIHQLIEQKKIPQKGVYGPMIELFDVDDKFVMAVETTGGGSLSHVLVESETVAARIVAELNKNQLGRVTFMPLANLNPKPMEELPQKTTDVIPLISRLKFDEKYKKAFQQVFGKTLIARDTKTAAAYSRRHNINCVTLDGDQVNRRGAISGGYNETSKSRIIAMKKVKESLATVAELSEELAQRKAETETLEKTIADILASMQRAKGDVRGKRSEIEEARSQLDKDRRNQDFSAGDLEAKKVLLEKLQVTVRSLTKDKEAMESEIGTELVSKLSASDTKELQTLIKEMTKLQKQLPSCQAQRQELELERNGLTSKLNEDLKKRQAELSEELLTIATQSSGMSQDSQGDSQGSDANTARLEEELASATTDESKLAEEQQTVDTRIADIAKELTTLKREMEKLRKDSDDGSVADVEARMEGLHNRRATLTAKKETATKNIRELGSLPADAFEKYRETSTADLLKKLKKCNEKLTKYSHVNKKALEQYVSFTEQREDLAGRLEELDSAKEAIQKLITVLDQRKDDAIQRTFKGVSQHFAEVFKQIVSSGKATLVMVKKKKQAEEDEEDEDGDSDEDSDEENEDPEDDPDDSSSKKRKSGKGGKKKKKKKKKAKKKKAEPNTGTLQWSGVSIKVSFTGHGEVYQLNQLSGGQVSNSSSNLASSPPFIFSGTARASSSCVLVWLFSWVLPV